jgi:hypothetical protein
MDSQVSESRLEWGPVLFIGPGCTAILASVRHVAHTDMVYRNLLQPYLTAAEGSMMVPPRYDAKSAKVKILRQASACARLDRQGYRIHKAEVSDWRD